MFDTRIILFFHCRHVYTQKHKIHTENKIYRHVFILYVQIQSSKFTFKLGNSLEKQKHSTPATHSELIVELSIKFHHLSLQIELSCHEILGWMFKFID